MLEPIKRFSSPRSETKHSPLGDWRKSDKAGYSESYSGDG
jgi:hypothetical protein